MVDNRFFEESREQSLIKATIVAKYFWAWAKVIIGAMRKYPELSRDKIAYVDLFAGPGRYKDGSASTPIRVLEKAVEEPDIRERLVTIFNDKDEENRHSLEAEIKRIPNLHLLKHQPQVLNEEVGDKIVQNLEQAKLVPTLCFVDPWGYKGLSLRLVNSVLKDWGCDCIFFFNYNRISMGLSNPFVVEHMNALFGQERADDLRDRLEGMEPFEREMTIVNELTIALKELGGEYVLPFCFKNERGVRTSHHLIFVSKHVRGYEIMKEIMAEYSSNKDQGVPSFEYNPADERYSLLFELTRPLDELVR
ncbi:TPA: three-Cys-motif partner protein TcmP, partial [Candidatus Micrarchaeota archaeon]|nr:three-Cys-motif partner protein TcmP [Candidatus Micrarchaeota archaeon]